MRDALTVRSSDRWTITEKGREDLENEPTCLCQPRMVGLLFACEECGTVYGHLRSSSTGIPAYRGKRE